MNADLEDIWCHVASLGCNELILISLDYLYEKLMKCIVEILICMNQKIYICPYQPIQTAL